MKTKLPENLPPFQKLIRESKYKNILSHKLKKAFIDKYRLNWGEFDLRKRKAKRSYLKLNIQCHRGCGWLSDTYVYYLKYSLFI